MTWRFPWQLGNGPLPDGLAYTAVATATVVGGQTFTATGGLVLDVVPPAVVTPTLTSDGAARGSRAARFARRAPTAAGLDARERRQRPGSLPGAMDGPDDRHREHDHHSL